MNLPHTLASTTSSSAEISDIPIVLTSQLSYGTPLLLGRLKLSRDNRCTLTGHMGDIRTIPAAWYEIIRRMDGFHSFKEISTEARVSQDEVEKIFFMLKGGKRIGFLEEWNQCYWCATCRLYLSRLRVCSLCNSPTEQVPLLPPCDPWIFFGEEYRFIAQLLKDHASIEIDENRFLLGNNGVRNNRFFWQVIYDGHIALHIDFKGFDPKTWEVSITESGRNADWRRSAAPRAQEIERHVTANRSTLQAMEADSIAFLEEVSGIFPGAPLLYFSGGKESVVMLRLLEKAGQKANLVFVGTGVDFPEDADFLLNELKPLIESNPLFNLEINIAPPERFLDIFREKGELDARSAWCREYIKAPLKAEITNRLYGDQHFVALEGSRWYENDFRRSHPRINFVTGYEKQIWVHPVAGWTGLDIWLYMYAEKLKINPMYSRGYQRTTCWLCPIVNPFHLHSSKLQYPDLWRQIEGLQLKGFDNGDNLNTPF